MRRIGEHGRDGFYKGPTAEAILKLSREQHGFLEADDLADFQPEWVEPVSTTYHGWTVWEMPPNGQGIAALSMLNIMERFPIAAVGPQQPEVAARGDRGAEAGLCGSGSITSAIRMRRIFRWSS